MAMEYYTPGVYVEEVSSGSKPMTAAPTHIVGFLGETRTGRLNRPIMVTSWTQYFDEFIGYHLENKITPRGTIEKDINGNDIQEDVPYDKVTGLDWGVYAFFANGGAKCHVVSANHIADNSEKIKALNLELKTQETALAKAKDKEKDVVSKKIEALKADIAKASSPVSNNTKELIGHDGGPNKRTGLTCFKDIAEVAILVAPGVVSPAVQQELISLLFLMHQKT